MNLSKTELDIFSAVFDALTPDQRILYNRAQQEREREESKEENFWTNVAEHVQLKTSAKVATPEEWAELDKEFTKPRIESFDEITFK